MHKLSILSHPKNLAGVRAKIKKIIGNQGFSPQTVSHIILAIDEACANIIRHSYLHNYSKKINIKVDIKPKGDYNKQLTIELRDYGVKPNLKHLTGRKPRKIRPGGLGVYFIRKTMDKVIYDVSKTRGTKLTMIKNTSHGLH